MADKRGSAGTPSVATFLLYEDFDPKDRLFVQTDGSVSVIWEIGQIPAESLDTDGLGRISEVVSSALRRVPEGFQAQVVYHSSRDTAQSLERWSEGARSDGVFEALTLARARKTQDLSLPDVVGEFVAKRISVYLSLKRAVDWKSPGFSRRLRALFAGEEILKESLYAQYERRRSELLQVARQIEASFGQLGVAPKRLDSNGLLALVHELLNPERSRLAHRPPKDDGTRPLSQRISLPEFDWDKGGGNVRMDGYFHRVLTVTDLPEESFSGMLSLETHGRAALDAAPELIVSMNVQFLDPPAERRRLKMRKRLVFSQMGSRDGQVEAGAAREELDAALYDMYAAGEVGLRARICFIVRDRNADELDHRVKDLQSSLASVGIETVEDQAYAGNLLLQSMPLAYVPETDEAIKRYRWMESMNLAHLLPVYGAFKGTPTPDLLLLNRRGEPVTFSLFDSETAPHAIAAGVTGSGKSVWGQNLLISGLRRGTRCFVLDRGHSYRRLCGLLGGEYVSFDIRKPICINPFGSSCDSEKLVFMINLVGELATHGERQITPKEQGLVTRAIREAYFGKPGQSIDLEDVRQHLRALTAEDAAAGDLALALEVFVGQGPYAGFFLGENQLAMDSALTVFELGELALRKEIASSLLMALVYNVTGRCMSDMNEEKLLLVDEAWTLLKTPNTAKFLENVFRTFRKYRTAAVMVTQQVTDFDGPVGRAILANAPNRIYLKQPSEAVRAMGNALALSQVQEAILRGVRSVKGSYSEALYQCTEGEGVLRLVLDDLTYWITTTDPADVAVLDEAIKKHIDGDDPNPVKTALMEVSMRGHQRAERRRKAASPPQEEVRQAAG